MLYFCFVGNRNNFFFRGVCSFELSGLKPYSLYEIKVAVQDQNNRKSEFSQKIQIRTLQGGILNKQMFISYISIFM